MVQPMTVPSVLTSPRHLPDRVLREEHTHPHNHWYIHARTRRRRGDAAFHEATRKDDP